MSKGSPQRASLKRGQSLLELALMFSVLLLILSGLVEFGFWMLDYSSMVVATRNAGRFAVDNDYRIIRPECHTSPRAPTCDPTNAAFSLAICGQDFYCKVAHYARQNLEEHSPEIYLDAAAGDDVVVSVLTFTVGHGITDRHPKPQGYWSYFGNQNSRFTNSEIIDMLTRQGLTNSSSGYVLVETFYNYHQKLGLPWLRVFIPDPIPLHAYTFMPLYSASPTPTP